MSIVQSERFAALRSAMHAAGLDAAAIVPGANFQYLTGARFDAMDRPTILIVPRDGEPRLVLPMLIESTWAKLGSDLVVHQWRDEEGYDGAFAAALNGLEVKRLGVEAKIMRVFEEMAIRRALPGAEIVDGHQAISSGRLKKNSQEILALRRAIAISEAALEATLKHVRIGVTERHIEKVLLTQLFACGAEALAFIPVVSAGPQTAETHTPAGEYKVREGDTVLFDFGASFEGYRADLTRTVFVGEPSIVARHLYETVREANRLGRATARPGISAGQLDDTVLRFLEGSEFRSNILHKTGHGLGLDPHEAPVIMRGNDQLLEPGMVITIEPGLYAPGVRGVRIEDDILITESGAECLSSFPRELRVVG